MTDLDRVISLLEELGIKYTPYIEEEPIKEYDNAELSIVIGSFGTIMYFTLGEEFLGETSAGNIGSYNRRKRNASKFMESSDVG